MHLVKVLIGFSCLLVSTAGFAAEEVKKVSYRAMIEQNVVNAAKLEKGMTRGEVMGIMGPLQSKVKSGPIDNPWKVEFLGDMEILHFITMGHPPFFPIKANQATPVVLVDGKVIGVGRGVLEEIKVSEAAKSGGSNSQRVGIDERLRVLKQLYEEGTIDKKDYEAQKKRILETI